MNQMYVPPLSRVNKILLIGYVGMFVIQLLVQMIAKINLVPILGLSAPGVLQGYVFQIFTFPFIDNQLMGVVFNGLILWFIGSELEQKWGERFYIKFLALSTYVPGLIYLLVGFFNKGAFLSFYGLNGTNLALLVAYSMVFSERILVFMFIFPMKAKYFCLLLAGIEVVMMLGKSISSLVHLVAMGIAFFYLRYASFVARGGNFSQLKQQRQKEKMRSKLRLVKDEEPERPDPDKPKYWQ